MKRLLAFIVLISGFLLFPLPAAGSPAAAAPPLADTLCLPGVYPDTPADCLPLGPSEYLTRLAQRGFTFPAQPLPAQAPNSKLAYLPYSYAKVIGAEPRVFETLEAAVEGKPVKRYIETGFDYVSYSEIQIVKEKKYYRIAPNEWMRANDLSAGVVTSSFMGSEFYGTPQRKFGWILFPLETQRAPGYQNRVFTGSKLARHDMIQVYDSVVMDDMTWHLIAPDQWVEQRYVALVYPVSEPPAGVENGRWIEINLYEQTVSVYENNQLVFATLTSTGLPGWWTRPGLFKIWEKFESTPMSGAFEADRSDYYYLEDVPWTMFFDEARAFHGAYWHNQFGYERSHGCANLSPGDSRWLFDWAVVGDWVYVWDPSGETPEDPSLYSAGGA